MSAARHGVGLRTAVRSALVGLVAVLVSGASGPGVAAADDELPPPVRVGGDVEVEVTVPDVGQGTTPPPTTGAAELTDAELRWGLNEESGTASHLSGACNFVMAGVPGDGGDAGGSRLWSASDDDLYRAAQGDVEILVPTADGRGERRPTFATRCQDPQGDPVVRDRSTSGAEVVIDGGVGTRAQDGSVDIAWTGTFTVVFYNGLTYWWASDPHLVLDENGDGALTATLGGYGTSREDLTEWSRLTEREVELATFHDGRFGATDGVLTPDWCGVDVGDVVADQSLVSVPGTTCGGSFPRSFVAFQRDTGQAPFWYSTAPEAGNAAKQPYPMTVSFDASVSGGRTEVPDPGTGDDADDPGTSTFVPQDLTGSAADPSTSSAAGGGASATSASGLGVPVRTAAPAAGAQPVVFPAGAVGTLGLGNDDLVPSLSAGGRAPGELLPWGVAAVALTASGSIVGFRRGWLVLPFT
ncbi:hypothetical protein ACNHYB_12020 [Isoptericola jiangsuensis]|uniref:hypothetical protein n=1 Tax=Isoptericola jiangsuensis TaxID=548579 RepID=UPI003AAD1B6F